MTNSPNINSYFKEGLARLERKTIQWLLSAEATKLRAKRLASNSDSYVVHVEKHNKNEWRFEELDADSKRHAHDLAEAWLTRHGAISVGIRKVSDSGSLSEPTILDSSDFDED
tara:strand:+ start:10495 stop:10833 length:339 start_codon:yes stop_codon:yes gene_type:complete